MKKLLYLFFVLTVVLAGCGSSKKQLQKGNWDAAIEKAVKQLRKNPEMKNRLKYWHNHIKMPMTAIMKEFVFLKWKDALMPGTNYIFPINH